MDKIFEKNMLYDFYGELLTEHQRRIYEDAVYGDYSLSELSEEYGITRQGVHDLLKRCDKLLEDYEAKLQLVEKFRIIRNKADKISKLSKDMSAQEANEIKRLAEEIGGLL